MPAGPVPVPAVVQVRPGPAESTGASTRASDQVLVGPLRPDQRRRELIARLELLPERLAVVLRGCYLQGLTAAEVAQSCRLAVPELAQLRADALTALGCTRPAAPRATAPASS